MVAIRGATTVLHNSAEEICDKTKELLSLLMEENNLIEDDLVSIIFSSTKDLNAAYPAVGAREFGLTNTPLFCVEEMAVTNSLPKCLRLLVHVNKAIPKSSVKHIYLGEAVKLRPDLAQEGEAK